MSRSCPTCRYRSTGDPPCMLLEEQVDATFARRVRRYLDNPAGDCAEWGRPITDADVETFLAECRAVFPLLEWTRDTDMGDDWIGAETTLYGGDLAIGRNVDKYGPWEAGWADDVVEATGATATECLQALASEFFRYHRDALVALQAAKEPSA